MAVGVGDAVAQIFIKAGDAERELALTVCEFVAVVVKAFFRGFFEFFKVISEFFFGVL
jgi:hypothetical protein